MVRYFHLFTRRGGGGGQIFGGHVFLIKSCVLDDVTKLVSVLSKLEVG